MYTVFFAIVSSFIKEEIKLVSLSCYLKYYYACVATPVTSKIKIKKKGKNEQFT